MSDEPNETTGQHRPSFTDRFLKPKKDQDSTDTYAEGIIPPERRKAAMQSLNQVEVRMGYLAAAFAALMGGLATLIFPRQRLVTKTPVKGACPTNYTLHKGTCEAYLSNQLVALALITLVFAIAIFIAVRMRRRTPATFASLITGVAFTSFSITVGAPFLIFGGWLLLRARRIQKFGTVNAKDTAALAGQARQARREGRPSPPGVVDARTARTEAKKSPSAKKPPPGPEPSGRYTPKAPTRKRPAPPVEEKKPSKWRQRLEGLDQES